MASSPAPISTASTPPPPVPGPVWERARRCSSEKLAGGVCTGLARHWDVDPLLVRALTVLLALSMGVGAVLYAAAWVLMPASEGPSIAAQRFPRAARMKPWQIIVILVVVWALSLPLLTRIAPFGLGPVVVLAVAYWLVRRSRRVQRSQRSLPGQTPASVVVSAATVAGSAASPATTSDTAPLEQFDPYTPAAEPTAMTRRVSVPQTRTRKSWLLTLSMLILAGVAGLAGYLAPVPHPPILALSLALGVAALFQLVGVWTRRPHLGVTLGLALAVALAGAVAVPRAEIPRQVIAGSTSTMVWDAPVDLPRAGITVAAGEATIDASKLSLPRDTTTVVAAIGSDLTITVPASVNVTVNVEATGGTVSTPDGSALSGNGANTWTGTHRPGEPTWTLKLKTIGANVKVVTS